VNIFFTSPDPVECAQALDDKRLVKMPVESVQMLSSAIYRHGGTPVYRVAWTKHPCTIWSGDSRENFEWHLAHLQAMNDEFKLRYGKDHGSYVAGYESLKAQAGRLGISALTNFPNCSLFKEELDVHKAYRMGFFESGRTTSVLHVGPIVNHQNGGSIR
jgi:hypothetical protein